MDFTYDNPPAPPNSPVLLTNTSTQNHELAPVPGVAQSKAPLEVHVISLTDPKTLDPPTISIHVNTAISTNSNTEIDDLSATFSKFSLPSKAGSRNEPRHRPYSPLRVKTKRGGIQKRVRFRERAASDTKKLRESFRIDRVAWEKSREPRKIRKMYLLNRKQELEDEVRETATRRMRQWIEDVAEKEGGDNLENLGGTKVDSIADDVLDMFGKMQIGDREGDMLML